MIEQLRVPVSDASAWLPQRMRQDRSWCYELTGAQSAELLEAARRIVARGKAPTGFAAVDFPLPTLDPLFAAAREEIVNGRGVVLLRGLPVVDTERPVVHAMYWGIGTRFGRAITQNLKGDLIAEITDLGLDVNALNVKPSLTNAEQRPHTDPGDIVALLCIHRARAGGLSRIASTMSIYNAILAEHPEYLDWLYRGFHHDLRGDASPAAPFGCTPKPIPVYRYFGRRLSCVFNASTIKDAQRRMGSRVPQAEMRAIDFMVDCAQSDRFRLDMDFAPGDLQILNNYTVLHWRTAFEDDPARKRLLYRLWLMADGLRLIDPEMAQGYITGAQTGVPVRADV